MQVEHRPIGGGGAVEGHAVAHFFSRLAYRGFVGAGGDEAAAGDFEIFPRLALRGQFLGQQRAHHVFQVLAGGKTVQPHAVGYAGGGFQHQRPYRGHRDGRQRQPLRGRGKLRGHQREIIIFALVGQLLTVLPATENGAQGINVFAKPSGGGDPGHAEAALVVGFYLAAQPHNEPPLGVFVQIPRLVRHDHRAAGKCDRDRGHQLHPLGRQRREGQGRERVVLQLVALDGVEPIVLRLARGGATQRPVVAG